MRFIKTLFFTLLSITFFACQQNQTKNQTENQTPVAATKPPAEEKKADDERPKDQIHFLEKVKAESDVEVTSNALKKDSHIAAFNKYVLDSLKNVKVWKFIVDEINDNSFDANSITKTMGNGNEVYNLMLVAPIKIDNSVDSIAMNNRVDFTYTIPKNPKGAVLKKQLEIIKGLNKGDVVIISGALTHIDDNGKVNFASFYDQYQPWKLDVLVSDIQKGSK